MDNALALVLYASLKSDVQDLSGGEIGNAVAEYLVDNPTALSDSLDLALSSDGLLCVVTE